VIAVRFRYLTEEMSPPVAPLCQRFHWRFLAAPPLCLLQQRYGRLLPSDSQPGLSSRCCRAKERFGNCADATEARSLADTQADVDRDVVKKLAAAIVASGMDLSGLGPEKILEMSEKMVGHKIGAEPEDE
jgi:hypothetical protein